MGGDDPGVEPAAGFGDAAFEFGQAVFHLFGVFAEALVDGLDHGLDHLPCEPHGLRRRGGLGSGDGDALEAFETLLEAIEMVSRSGGAGQRLAGLAGHVLCDFHPHAKRQAIPKSDSEAPPQRRIARVLHTT